jgi:hypothetical protein
MENKHLRGSVTPRLVAFPAYARPTVSGLRLATGPLLGGTRQIIIIIITFTRESPEGCRHASLTPRKGESLQAAALQSL